MNPTIIGESVDRPELPVSGSTEDEDVPAIEVLVTADEEVAQE